MQTKLFVQTIENSIWTIGSTSKGHGRLGNFPIWTRPWIARRGLFILVALFFLTIIFPTILFRRISLSDDEYRVIKPPMSIRASDCPQFYLGRSQKGVYCASLRGQARIQVWKLEESGCEIRWVLRHDKDLFKLLKHRINGGVVQGRPWILQDINCNYREYEQDDDTKPLVDERSEWSSEASVDDRFAWSSDNEDEVSESTQTPVEETAWSCDYR